eukprot:3901-Heterococcus_DN1.PRE.5
MNAATIRRLSSSRDSGMFATTISHVCDWCIDNALLTKQLASSSRIRGSLNVSKNFLYSGSGSSASSSLGECCRCRAATSASVRPTPTSVCSLSSTSLTERCAASIVLIMLQDPTANDTTKVGYC